MADGDQDRSSADSVGGIYRDDDSATEVDATAVLPESLTFPDAPGPVAASVPPPMPPPPPIGPVVPGYPGQVVIMVAPPAVTTTVLITLFFGLFGLIPASRHSQRAEQMGLSGGKYWKAFGITFGAMTMVNVIAVVLVNVLGAGLFLAMLSAASGGSYSSPTSGYQPSYAPASYSPPAYSYEPSNPASTTPTDTSSNSPTESTGDTGDHPALAGTWVAVLDSFDQNQSDISQARSLASQISTSYGVQVYVVDSGDYAGLNPGYWAVILSGYSSNEQARASCAQVGREPSDACYGRHITG